MIASCIHSIYDGETQQNVSDYSTDELDKFLESLDRKSFDKINKFFETMPKLSHSFSVRNPETKKETSVTLEGLTSFFG